MGVDTKGRSCAVVLAFVVLAVCSATAHAQSVAPPEGRDLLKLIFGVDPRTFATLLATPGDSLLATLSFTANVVAAFVAAVFLIYHGITFAVRAATRGEADPQKDGVWVFSRAAVALMFCAPLAGGYSFLQVILMWFAGLGSFMADSAWDQMKGQVQAAPSSVGSGPWLDRVVGSFFNPDVSDSVAKSMTCLALASQMYSGTYHASVGSTSSELIPTWQVWKDHGQRITWKFGGDPNDFFGLPSDACGSMAVTLPTPGDSPGQLSNEGYQVLTSLFPAAVDRYKDALFVAASDVTGEQRLPVGEQFALAERQFRIDLRDAVAAAMSASTPVSDKLLQSVMSRIEESGWVGAGTVYLAAAQYERSVNELAIMPFRTMEASSPSGDGLPEELQTQYAAYEGKVMDGITRRRESSHAMGDVSFMELMSSTGPASLVWQWFRDKLTDATTGIASGGDPLAAMQSFGQTTFALGAASLGAGGTGHVVSAAAGSEWGAKVIPGASAVAKAGEAAGILLVAVGFVLVGIGVMLGFYLPLLPAILWATGLVMWLVSVVQMVLVAPVWAVLHAAGEGDGLSGNRAQLGYQVTFAIFARPILMLGGLFAGLLVARIGVGVAGFIFGLIGDTMMDGVTNPLAGIVIVVIAAMTIVSIARFAFSLIYTLPDWAQRLVGAHEMGEGLQEHSLRGSVAGLTGELRQFSSALRLNRGGRGGKGSGGKAGSLSKST